MLYWDWYPLAIMIMLAVATKLSPQSVKFDQKVFVSGSGILFAIFAMSATIQAFVINPIAGQYFPEFLGYINDVAKKVAMMDGDTFFRVWWEDVVYVLPAVVLYHKGFKKSAVALLIACMPSFVEGHLYQGAMGYMSFMYMIVAFNVAIRHGIITMMFFHMLYDVLIFSRCVLVLRGYL